ncbi:MAG: CotD family spore coat protein [Bacilli bacterium]
MLKPNANMPYPNVGPSMKGDMGDKGHAYGVQQMPMMGGHQHCCQPQVCYAPPVVHPTCHQVVNTYSTVIVPHIHSQHTTVVNHKMIQNQHHFEQSTSQQQTMQQTDVSCGGGMGGHGMPSPMGGHGMPSPMGNYGMMQPNNIQGVANANVMGNNNAPIGK